MLVLSRKSFEDIIIDGNIIVKVLEVHGQRVKIGIEAPKEINVARGELHEARKLKDEKAKIPKPISPQRLSG